MTSIAIHSNKMRFGGKLSLEPNTPLHMHCHNDPNKKECDNCISCFSQECTGTYCDAHNECICVKTQCICQGRN